LTYTCYEEI